MTGSNYKRLFIILCFLVLITRIAVWFALANDERRFLDLDTPSYTLPAKALLETGRFMDDPLSGKLTTFRSPGYPVWIALHYAIFGESSNALVMSNLLLFIGTLALLFNITEKLFDKRTAFLASVLLSFDPPSFVSSFKVLTETTANFFTMLFIYFVVSYLKDKGKGVVAIYAALALTAATFVRPATYYLLPFLIIFLAIFHIKTRTPGKEIIWKMTLLALPFVLLVGMWQVRNHKVANTYQFVTHTGMALLWGKGANIISVKENPGLGSDVARVYGDLVEKMKIPPGTTQPEADLLMKKEAIRIILENPWLAIKTQIFGLINFALEPGTTSALFRLVDPQWKIAGFNWAESGTYFKRLFHENKVFALALAVGCGYLGSLYIFVFYFALCLRGKFYLSKNFWEHTFFLLFIFYIANIYALGNNGSRYRTVIMPLICMYAAAGLVKFLNKRKES